MKLNGYKEAEKIDKEINALLKKHPNARDWMNFCRTVESSLQLLNKLAYEELTSKKACQETEEDCPEAGRRLKAENQKWVGTWPSKCQICPVDLSQQKYFVDGKTKQGSWALMCPLCHIMYGVGLGLGKGQKYDSKTLEKLEG